MTERPLDAPEAAMDGTTADIVAIIVNYNTGNLLQQAVDSLLSGTMVPMVEIVDNASTDDSLSFLRDRRRYADAVKVTVNDENLGFARANNQILGERSAHYYVLINPDCVVHAGAVAQFVSGMNANPDIGLAGGLLVNPDGTVQKTSKRRFPTPLSSLARSLGLHTLGVARGKWSDFDLGSGQQDRGVEVVEAVSGAMMCARASALTKVGLLDEAYFMHCEDLDWCKRFWEAGYTVASFSSAVATHAKGGSGRGPKVVWHLHRGMIRFYNKFYRREHSLVVAALVHTAVYVRCLLLMAVSIFRRDR